MKTAANKEARARFALATTVVGAAGVATGLPLLTTEFQAKLVRQGKKMFKDPPLPPPGGMVVKAESAPLPKRNVLTRELMFAPGDDGGLAGLLCNFCSNHPVVLSLLLQTAVLQ